jgi:uncharacterized membrane protein YoaK (UPF0700 family)
MSAAPAAATSSPPSSLARRDLLVLLLALAGGGVDAVVILGFGVLTAAQTGNTILLAVALAQGQFTTGVHSATSIAGYMLGAAVGELVIVGRRVGASWLTPVGRTLLAELVPLVGLLIAWRLAGPNPDAGTSTGLVALAAMAMGIQSAAVLRIHAGPTTTYVTGTLTTFTTETIRWLRLIETAAPLASTPQEPSGTGVLSSERPWIYGVTWLVYAGGALSSGLLFLWVGAAALFLPIAAIVAVVVAGLAVREKGTRERTATGRAVGG